MGKRKRITKTIKTTEVTEVIEIVDDFKPNCASQSAKFIHNFKDFEFEIWIDKHYEIRLNQGDEFGKREGIDEEKIIELIVVSIKYIFHFYIKNRLTNYINFFNRDKPTKNRIVIKDWRDTENPLNIVVEIHFLDFGKYEITTITAMKCIDFKLSDGQYNITISDNSVNLNRFVNRNLGTIDKINL